MIIDSSGRPIGGDGGLMEKLKSISDRTATDLLLHMVREQEEIDEAMRLEELRASCGVEPERTTLRFRVRM